MDKNQDYYLRKQYSQEFKMQVCREHIDTGCSLRSLVLKYGLSSHSLIHEWLRRYRFIEDNGQVRETITFGTSTNLLLMNESKENGADQNFEKLQSEKRIADLEQQLKEAQMKAIAYSTMVDIAEKDFKISIRKKFNTKP